MDFIRDIQRNKRLVTVGGKEALVFSQLITLAWNEERSLKREDEKTVVIVARSNLNSNSNGANVKTCTKCNRRGHNIIEYYVEHPELALVGWKPRGKFNKNNRNNNNKWKKDTSKKNKDDKSKKPSKDDCDSNSDTDTSSIRKKAKQFAGVAIIWKDVTNRLDAVVALLTATEKRDNPIMDTSCSRHASGDKDRFFNMRPVTKADALSGIGDFEMKPLSIGSLRLPGPGVKLILNDAYYIPGIGVNLVSIGQLEAGGVKFGWGSGAGRSGGLNFTINGIVYTITRSGQIYLLDTWDA